MTNDKESAGANELIFDAEQTPLAKLKDAYDRLSAELASRDTQSNSGLFKQIEMLRAEVERLKLECQQTEDNLQEAWRVSDAQIKLSAELLKKLDEAQEQQKTWKALAEQYMYQYAKMKPNEQCPLEERTCSRRSRDATRSEGKVSGG